MTPNSPTATPIRVVVATHPGLVREENQDQFCVAGIVSGGHVVAPIPVVTHGGFIAAVIDGMGGHAGGRVAARTVAETLAEPSGVWNGIVDQLRGADARLYDRMDHQPQLRGMGATVVLLVIDEHGWTLCNVGDARAYLHRDGYSVVVSTDDRVRGSDGVISQSLGGADRPVGFQPHITPLEVHAGDRLLLCSDGLSDVVPLAEIQEALAQPLDLTDVVAQLIEAALAAGAPDNVTIVALEVPEPVTD